ncbi:MAG: GIY-YIG nuclease family protein [Bacteroidia bacterium]|nr:GIY-YIG nuclease family protein [Bacteroidia bacterium]
MTPIHIYILFSVRADKFYIGRAQNPWKRLEMHNNGEMEKFTGKYKDWQLLAVFEVRGSSGDAEKIERYLKTQAEEELIVKMVKPDYTPKGPLEKLYRVER